MPSVGLIARLLAVLALAVLAGCGDDGGGGDQTNGGSPANVNGQKEQKEEAGGFTGIDARNYKTAKEACGQPGFLPEGMRVRRAAELYAFSFPPRRKQAAVEGCLEGIRTGGIIPAR
jgi:hypothetical protein